MTQLQLHCAIAQKTGDSPALVAQVGFQETNPHWPANVFDPLLVIDCPGCGAPIMLSSTGPDDLPEIAECQRCDTLFDYHDDEIQAIELENWTAAPVRDYRPAA